MKRSGRDPDPRPLKPTVAAGQRETSKINPAPSRSASARRQATDLRQTQRPSAEVECPPPQGHEARSPSAPGPSVAAARRGPPGLKPTTSTSASASPVPTKLRTLGTFSELSGTLKRPPLQTTGRRPTGTKRVSAPPTKRMRDHFVDLHEASTVLPGELEPHQGVSRMSGEQRREHERSDDPLKGKFVTLKADLTAKLSAGPKSALPSSHTMQASSCTDHVAKTSSLQAVATSTKRQQSVATSVPRPDPDTEIRTPATSTLPLPDAVLRKKHELDTKKAMGDVTCYGAWKTEIQESTRTNSRSTGKRLNDKVLRPDGPLAGAASSTVFLKDPSEDSSSGVSARRPSELVGSSPTIQLRQHVTSRQPGEFTENSATSLNGGLEDLRRGPYALPDDGTLEVTVDITKRHHVPAAAPASATSSADRSSFSSVVERVLATIMIRPGNTGPIKKEPPKPKVDPVQLEMSKTQKDPLDIKGSTEKGIKIPEPQKKKELDSKKPGKPKESVKREEDIQHESPFDYDSFLPHSEEALPYTELLEYPKVQRTISAKLSAKESKAKKPKEPEEDIRHGWPVNYEQFLPQSQEALNYTELLKYPKLQSKRESFAKPSPKEPMKPETPKEPEEGIERGQPVDYERFPPHSKEALPYTELLEYPKKHRKLSTEPDKKQLLWGTQGVSGVSPPVKAFSWSSPESTSPLSPTGYPSPSKPIGPSKRETTPPPSAKPPPTIAVRPSSGSVHDASEELKKPTLSKEIDKKTEETPRPAPPPRDTKASPERRIPSRSLSQQRVTSLAPSQKGTPEARPERKRTIPVRPFAAAFHEVEGPEEHDEVERYFSPSTPSTVTTPTKHLSEVVTPAEQTASISPEVRSLPVKRLSFESHDDSRDEEQKSASTQHSPLAHSEKVPYPQGHPSPQRPGPGTRPFSAFYHDTSPGRMGSAPDAGLVITVKELSTPPHKATEKTTTIRPFVTSVGQTSAERLERKPATQDTKDSLSHGPDFTARTASLIPLETPSHAPPLKTGVVSNEPAKAEGIGHATSVDQKDTNEATKQIPQKPPEEPQPGSVSKPTTGPPAGMCLLTMSTMDKGFRERMLWDYGPVPPPKTPLLHIKDEPAASTTPGQPPTITTKEIVAPQHPMAPTATVAKQAVSTPAKAATPQPTAPESKAAKGPVSAASKAAAPRLAAPTAKVPETVAKTAKATTPQTAAAAVSVSKEAVPALPKTAATQPVAPTAKVPQETVAAPDKPGTIQGSKPAAEVPEAIGVPAKTSEPKPVASTSNASKENAAPLAETAETKALAPSAEVLKEALSAPPKTAAAEPAAKASQEAAAAPTNADAPQGTKPADELPAKASLGKPYQESAASKEEKQMKPQAGAAPVPAAKLTVGAATAHKPGEEPTKAPGGQPLTGKAHTAAAVGQGTTPVTAKPTQKAALIPVKTAATDPETGIKGPKPPAEKSLAITTATKAAKPADVKAAFEAAADAAAVQKSTSTPEMENEASPGSRDFTAAIVDHKKLSGEQRNDAKPADMGPAFGVAGKPADDRKSTPSPQMETQASPASKDFTTAIADHKTLSGETHKAHMHKCARHRNETQAQYEIRKAKAKASSRMRAIAKAQIEEEERISEVRSRLKKKKKRKPPSPEKEATDLSGKKYKSPPIVTPDHTTKSGKFPCCIIFLIILLILIALLLYLFFRPVVPEESTTTTTSQIVTTDHTGRPPALGIYYCSSSVCNAEAMYLKSLLSNTKNPCDNFYEYVCEGWSRAYAAPGGGAGGVVSRDTILQDKIAIDIEPVLLGMQDADVKIAAGLHGDCMRRDKVGQDGDTVVNVARDLFRDWAIKEWPVLKNGTVTTEVAWMFAGELVRDLNVAALASVSVGISPKVLEAAAIELDKPQLVFSCNDASRPAVTKLFKDALMEVMGRFATASAAVGNRDVDNVINVFIRLASSPALAASPDTSPIIYTNVKLVELDTGYKNFLEAVFNSIVQINDTTEVVLKNPDYLRNHLKAAMQELPPHAVVNYLGFMALVKASPFFPEKFSNLRQVFGKDVLDRTLPDVSQTKALCLLAVQQVLPGCFAKAAARLRGMSHTDLPLAEWLSRLESTFGRHQERVAWIGELSALIVRYRLRRNRIAALPWGGNSSQEPCAPSPQEIPRRNEHPLRFYHQVSMLQEQKRLQLVLKTGQEVLAQKGEARSELATIPEYDVMRQSVHVPMALFNTSVASNTTTFSFHLSRVAVRLYRALVQVLFPNIYEREAPLALSQEMARRLDKLLSCFEEDLSKLPADVRGPVSVDSAKFRGALLQHAAAVRLAFRAFEDLHSVRRVWNVDFRFKELPDFSSDALFFIYYALDNCESADPVYEEHLGSWMPAHYRVNAALRHVPNFASEFKCTDGCPMAAQKVCDVLKGSRRATSRR